MTQYQWQLAEQPDPATVQQLSQTLAVPPFLATLLWQRGIKNKPDYEAFVHPDISRLHDPFALHDMDKAVARILEAIEQNQKITIYGDYDVDGLTSSSIMLETLQSLGAEPDVFIPDRFTDGYGPNAEVYAYLQKTGTQLVITVDNGVAGADVIDPAQAAGMDVVVTDHHELPETLPHAVAVVHPRHPEGHYPFGDLSGAGVAFKVATALLGEPPLESIDLAALGTIADLVKLTDENRIIAQLGLKMIQTQPRVGLAAILKEAGVAADTVNETTVGFVIGPRLNALGRMGDANPGVTLLTTFEEDVAAELAQQVGKLNQERQGLVSKIAQEALTMAQTPENQAAKTLLLANKGWHEGVVGIVASKVVEATGKPTLIMNIADDGDTAKGSGRSIEAYHLFNALEPAKDKMVHFGGHHMAVGLTAKTAELSAIHAQMEAAAATMLKTVPKPALPIAARLEVGDLTLEHYELIRQLAPFGQGNPEPTFSVRPQVVQNVKPIGKENAHLRFQIDQGVNVIGFGFGSAAATLAEAQAVKLAVRLDQNTWQGNTSLQLMLKDYAVKQPQVVDWRMPTVDGSQFKAQRNYVFFDAKVKQQFEHQFSFGGPTMLAEQVTTSLADAVLVDLPKDRGQLVTVMQHIQLPVTVMFYGAPSRLVAMPTRSEFGAVLHFLKAHPGFDKHHIPAIAKAVHLTVHQVILVIQVFFELDFVTIEGAFISPVTAPAKKPLQTAKAYVAREAFLTLARQLQTLPRVQLETMLVTEHSDSEVGS